MRDVSIDTITDIVTDTIAADVPPRTREILTALVRHLHAFAREVDLTHAEWLDGCRFLYEAGRHSDERRNEFILLSDILGLEVLVDMLDHRVTEAETPSTVLGPFYREGAPTYPNGGSIVLKRHPAAETVTAAGLVRDTSGRPLAGAVLEVWETDANGLYEHEDPAQPDMNLRGRFETDADGRYAFECIRPVSYPIPGDKTCGAMLDMMKRSPTRPGHLHAVVSAPGHQRLVTQIYDAADPHLDSDAVFGVKEGLIAHFTPAPAGMATNLALSFDFVLKPAAEIGARAA
jgi:catechol 1,2-dioxygenase